MVALPHLNRAGPIFQVQPVDLALSKQVQTELNEALVLFDHSMFRGRRRDYLYQWAEDFRNDLSWNGNTSSVVRDYRASLQRILGLTFTSEVAGTHFIGWIRSVISPMTQELPLPPEGAPLRDHVIATAHRRRVTAEINEVRELFPNDVFQGRQDELNQWLNDFRLSMRATVGDVRPVIRLYQYHLQQILGTAYREVPNTLFLSWVRNLIPKATQPRIKPIVPSQLDDRISALLQVLDLREAEEQEELEAFTDQLLNPLRGRLSHQITSSFQAINRQYQQTYQTQEARIANFDEEMVQPLRDEAEELRTLVREVLSRNLKIGETLDSAGNTLYRAENRAAHVNAMKDAIQEAIDDQNSITDILKVVGAVVLTVIVVLIIGPEGFSFTANGLQFSTPLPFG